jgi:hypothetical protein
MRVSEHGDPLCGQKESQHIVQKISLAPLINEENPREPNLSWDECEWTLPKWGWIELDLHPLYDLILELHVIVGGGSTYFIWSSLCGGNVRQDGRKAIPWPITFSKCFTHQQPSYEGYLSTIMRSLLQSAFGFYSWSKEHWRVVAFYSPKEHESPDSPHHTTKDKIGNLVTFQHIHLSSPIH